MSVVVLGAMGIAVVMLGFDSAAAVTVSFLTLALAQLWHVFNMRDSWRHVCSNEITRNPYIWAALALCLILTVGAVYTPGISNLLALSHPGARGWILVLVMSFMPLPLAPLVARYGFAAYGKPQSGAT
jgi:Ca2+-transporting ATPase